MSPKKHRAFNPITSRTVSVLTMQVSRTNSLNHSLHGEQADPPSTPISIISQKCGECKEKLEVFRSVRGQVNQAKRALYPFRNAAYSFHCEERKKALDYEMACKVYPFD